VASQTALEDKGTTLLRNVWTYNAMTRRHMPAALNTWQHN